MTGPLILPKRAVAAEACDARGWTAAAVTGRGATGHLVRAATDHRLRAVRGRGVGLVTVRAVMGRAVMGRAVMGRAVMGRAAGAAGPTTSGLTVASLTAAGLTAASLTAAGLTAAGLTAAVQIANGPMTAGLQAGVKAGLMSAAATAGPDLAAADASETTTAGHSSPRGNRRRASQPT